jgi:zona occludens toxin (predicted ATPase)
MNAEDVELGLIVKLRALNRHFHLDTGITTLEQRRAAVRAAIEPWLEVTYTIRNGKRITMAMQYATAYGEVP